MGTTETQNCHRIQHLQQKSILDKTVLGEQRLEPLKNLAERCDGAILIGARFLEAPSAEGPNNIEAGERNQAGTDLL
jgi:hypothetical protein